MNLEERIKRLEEIFERFHGVTPAAPEPTDNGSPLYQHDCDECVYLGAYHQQLPGQVQSCDLYFCSKENPYKSLTVIARFGDAGDQYTSGLALVASDDRLAEAKRRAIHRGLLAEPAVDPGEGWELCEYESAEHYKFAGLEWVPLSSLEHPNLLDGLLHPSVAFRRRTLVTEPPVGWADDPAWGFTFNGECLDRRLRDVEGLHRSKAKGRRTEFGGYIAWCHRLPGETEPPQHIKEAAERLVAERERPKERQFKDGATYSNPKLWIDGKGDLWKGPFMPEENIHFCRCEGFDDEGDLVWVGRASECPVDCKLIPRFSDESDDTPAQPSTNTVCGPNGGDPLTHPSVTLAAKLQRIVEQKDKKPNDIEAWAAKLASDVAVEKSDYPAPAQPERRESRIATYECVANSCDQSWINCDAHYLPEDDSNDGSVEFWDIKLPGHKFVPGDAFYVLDEKPGDEAREAGLQDQLAFTAADRDYWKEKAKALEAATKGNVWHHQGDGEDHPESLTCHVVMDAEDYRKLMSLQAREAAVAELVEAAECAQQYLADMAMNGGPKPGIEGVNDWCKAQQKLDMAIRNYRQLEATR